jgi:hypothetical protein
MKVIACCLCSFLLLSCTFTKTDTQITPSTSNHGDSVRHKEEELNSELQWKPVNKDSLLWKSKNGDIGIRTSFYRDDTGHIESYLTNFRDSLNTPYADVIDSTTYTLIVGGYGFGGYFKDRKNIYHFFGNSGGGSFYIVDGADHNTFKSLNNCYAIDINHVYDLRFGVITDADAKTFKIVDNDMCIAKDKNGYYRGNTLLTEKDYENDPDTKAIVEKDKKLQTRNSRSSNRDE